MQLISETINKAKEIIEEKNPNLPDKDEVAKKVGVGAIVFNTLASTNIKDQVFDWNVALNFQGETGPYIQYTYVRTRSVLEKIGEIPELKSIKAEKIMDEYSLNLIELLYNFEDTLKQVTFKNEPGILARYLIDVAKNYSIFYNENKIINEDKDLQNARVYLTNCVSKVLKQGAYLLGIEMPEKM